MVTTHVSATDEFVEFLTSTPSLDDIAAFHLSQAAADRVQQLEEAHRGRPLTFQEQSEIDSYRLVEQILQRARIRAFEKQGTA